MGEALTNGAKRRRNGSTKGGREKGSRGPRRTKGKKTGDEERRGRGGGRRGEGEATVTTLRPNPSLRLRSPRKNSRRINTFFLWYSLLPYPHSQSPSCQISLSLTLLQSRKAKKGKQTRTPVETEARAHGVVSYAKLSDSLSETDAWLGTLNVIT